MSECLKQYAVAGGLMVQKGDPRCGQEKQMLLEENASGELPRLSALLTIRSRGFQPCRAT